MNLGKFLKTLWRISTKPSEKSYTAAKGENIKFSKLLPTKELYIYTSHIEEFHLLITKHLMLKAIKHAKLYTSITQHQLDISCTSEKPYYFPKINLGRKQLMNHYLI